MLEYLTFVSKNDHYRRILPRTHLYALFAGNLHRLIFKNYPIYNHPRRTTSNLLCLLHGKKFEAAAAPRGNAAAFNRKPQRALCIGWHFFYFENAAFPVWGDCCTEVLWQKLSVNSSGVFQIGGHIRWTFAFIRDGKVFQGTQKFSAVLR